ncbi:HEAT repeat domain-containing protein [Candidatus Electrothrix sp.]|uniref:HEAT repeat domain-containing protein n=1 Tax=Candidatus Electrothrix sp. TaxID=2170559 RepID=UPI004056BD35
MKTLQSHIQKTSSVSQQTEQSRIDRMFSQTLLELIVEKKDQQADILLDQLVSWLYGNKAQIRTEAVTNLIDCLELLIAHREWQRIEKLLPAVSQALTLAVEDDELVWQIITALSIFVAYQIEIGRYAPARKALLIFSGPNALDVASADIREQAEQLVNDLATKPLMELLLIEYLYDRNKGEDAGRLLVLFGEAAAEFLIEPQSLQQSRGKPDALLKLFENIGQVAEKSLGALLHRTTDWYLLRNSIKMLGEKGSSSCFADVTALLSHDDLRVKGEVLRAASKIESKDKKAFFLKALHSVPKQLKEPVVALLGEIPDSSLVAPLADLLDEVPYTRNKAGYQLRTTICKTLGKIGSVKAIPTLKKIIADSSEGGKEGGLAREKLVLAAEQAIQSINHGGKYKAHRAVAETLKVPLKNNPVAARETNIVQIAMAGDQARATSQLFDLIVERVHHRDFYNAERLRERFNEINPNALTEIIQATELIEQEKNGVQVRGYLEIWSNLLRELTAEEFSAIYHELENRELQPDEVLVNQGDKNDELFFINHGMIKSFYQKNGRSVYVKSLSGGDLAGENFFNASVWTISMTAQTESKISILKRSSFARWQEAFPGLEAKLRAFYNRSNDVQGLLLRKGLNRRAFERYQLSRKIEFQIINNLGNSMGQRFKGRLSDISRGGLAMNFHLSQKKHIRVLFGRKLHISIPVAGKTPELHVYGLVLSISPVEEEGNEYKLHFVFDTPMEQETLQQVLG